MHTFKYFPMPCISSPLFSVSNKYNCKGLLKLLHITLKNNSDFQTVQSVINFYRNSMYLPNGYFEKWNHFQLCETAWKCGSPPLSFLYSQKTVIWKLIMTVYPRLVLPFLKHHTLEATFPLGQEQSQDIWTSWALAGKRIWMESWVSYHLSPKVVLEGHAPVFPSVQEGHSPL